MTKLININDALEKLCEYCSCGSYEECDYRCSEFENISNIPAVDAVEVVRCKDCEWGGKCEVECLLREIDKIADPYCAAGKRREENAAD